MKNAVSLFSELGARLREFGDDDATRRVVAAAHAANGWFLPEEIVRAVRTLADGMLRRERLEAWLGAYPALRTRIIPRRVLVVMAGNIPLVGFFDLLCVLAGGHRCLIKPSAKDRVLMEYVVRQLRELEEIFSELPAEARIHLLEVARWARDSWARKSPHEP